jgi:hypothetical protein
MTVNHPNPSRSSRQLKTLCLATAASAAVVLFAPLLQSLLGLPPFTLRARLIASAFAFAFGVPAFWIAFSRRSDVTARTGIVAISIILTLLLFAFWRYH